MADSRCRVAHIVICIFAFQREMEVRRFNRPYRAVLHEDRLSSAWHSRFLRAFWALLLTNKCL